MTEATAVLLISDRFRMGGVPRVIVDLANGLHSRGFDVHVAADDEGPMWKQLHPGVRQHRPNRGTGIAGFVRYVAEVRRIVKENAIAIVHPHQRGVALVALLATAGTRASVIEHVHNTFTPPDKKLMSFRSHRLIACGPQVEEMLLNDYRRSRRRTRLIVNGVKDKAPEGPPAVPASTQSPGGLSIVGVGRMAEQKDPERFVRIVAHIRGLGVDVRASWVGNGPLRESCEQLASVLGVEDRIRFIGEVDDITPYVIDADLLLLTSRWEGLPLVALEALSLGRGLILPDVGSCRTVVGESNGILYRPDEADEDIAARIAAVTPETLVGWGRNARDDFMSSYTFDRVLNQVIDVYAEETARRARQS